MAILTGAVAVALAACPLMAQAHPLAHGATETQVPVAVEQDSAGAATEASPLDAGIEQAVDEACALAATEGDELLDTQADLVSDQVAESAADAAEAAEAAEESAAPAGEQAADATAPTTSAPAQAAFTINVDGDVMSYVDTYLADTAPAQGAGLWMGSDSTTDGTWGYFIGHNPGPFHHVMDLTTGDAVTVTDRAGASRTYHVVDVFTIPDTTMWEDIQARVTGHGESIVLQTCCGDNANYRVVVAV